MADAARTIIVGAGTPLSKRLQACVRAAFGAALRVARVGSSVNEIGRVTEGLVLTIEPIISAGAGNVVESQDGWTLRTRDGSRAAHHEETIVITGTTPVVLTAA